MATYKCGDRKCTDDELDLLEKMRKGEAWLTELGGSDPAGGPLAERVAKLENRIPEDFCTTYPSLCAQVNRIAGEPNAEGHQNASPELLNELASCPNCKPAVDKWLDEEAAKRGYVKPAAPVPPKAEDPPAVPAEKSAAGPPETETTASEPEDPEEENHGDAESDGGQTFLDRVLHPPKEG